RQAFLCGYDPVTGNDYSERRTWIRGFQEILAGIFAIEIAFRCEMSNHLHLVLKAEPEVVKHWSDEEVVTRWLRLSGWYGALMARPSRKSPSSRSPSNWAKKAESKNCGLSYR